MQISEETRVVINLLSKFGALTIDQIAKMLDGSPHDAKRMIAFMCNARMIQFIDDNYAVLQNRPSYTPETLYCIWVMLFKIKEDVIYTTREIRSASKCDDGTEVCFINRDNVIEYISFVDKDSISKVSFIQDTFYNKTGIMPGEEEKSRRLYTFVINDKAVMDVLSRMDLTIPFMVAYVKGELTSVPEIEFYG